MSVCEKKRVREGNRERKGERGSLREREGMEGDCACVRVCECVLK